jgi:glycosyltransferase involved in cell wall biosynthesis
MTEQTTVSFIIPHRGRIDLLQKTIDSICKQSYPTELLEIIIVTQDNSNVLKNTVSKCSVSLSVIQRPDGETISSMRNFGVGRTNCDFCAFIDADIFLAENWTRSMIEDLSSSSERILVAAPQRTGTHAITIVEKIRTAMGNSIGGVTVTSLPGHNLFMARKTFLELGGFPAHLRTCEDYCFTVSLAEKGLLYTSDKTWYIHLGEDKSFCQVFKKEYWRAGSNLKSLRGRKIPLREYPSILLPFWFIITLGGFIAGIIVNNPLAFAVMFGAYFLPIFLYSLRLSRRAAGISFFHIFYFYLLYHNARSFGTIAGFLKK